MYDAARASNGPFFIVKLVCNKLTDFNYLIPWEKVVEYACMTASKNTKYVFSESPEITVQQLVVDDESLFERGGSWQVTGICQQTRRYAWGVRLLW